LIDPDRFFARGSSVYSAIKTTVYFII